MSWREAIRLVLEERGEPVHYSEIADEILQRKLVDTQTATPANTVYAVCMGEMKKAKPDFLRVGTALFALSNQFTSSPGIVKPPPVEDVQASWIQSLGVLW